MTARAKANHTPDTVVCKIRLRTVRSERQEAARRTEDESCEDEHEEEVHVDIHVVDARELRESARERLVLRIGDCRLALQLEAQIIQVLADSRVPEA